MLRYVHSANSGHSPARVRSSNCGDFDNTREYRFSSRARSPVFGCPPNIGADSRTALLPSFLGSGGLAVPD